MNKLRVGAQAGNSVFLFDVVNPPQHYVDRYLGKSLDLLQWKEARANIVEEGYRLDPRINAYVKPQPVVGA